MHGWRCCRLTLDHTCLAQAATGSAGGAGGTAAVAPPALLAATSAPHVPGDSGVAAAPAQPDAARTRLQEAFLTQYSPDHAQVPGYSSSELVNILVFSH